MRFIPRTLLFKIQHEFENQDQWLPERSSLDSRIRSGTHQNWGLWEETKSKMKPEDFTIQSDYTANYHGNIEFLKSAFGTFGE